MSTSRTIVIQTLVTPYTVLCQLMPLAVTPIRQPLPGVTFRIDYECIVTPLSAIKPCSIGINSQLASSYLLYSFTVIWRSRKKTDLQTQAGVMIISGP